MPVFIFGSNSNEGFAYHFTFLSRCTVFQTLLSAFDGIHQNECLNENWFKDIEEAKSLIEDWRIFYNSEKSHSSLGGPTPEEYLRRSA
nr:integrase core domain-containing protein [Leptospira interrogans]